MFQTAEDKLRSERFRSELGRHADRIFAYIFTLLPNRADAEDVFQRSSLILWRKFSEWDRDTSFLSWALQVAFYEVQNFRRIASRDRLWFSDDLLGRLADAGQDILRDRDDRTAALLECLKRLDATERELIDSAYREDKSIKEVAEQTGRPVQTLYNRLGFIRRKLVACIQLSAALGAGRS